MAKILIVDDSDKIVNDLDHFFREQGFEILTAGDGEQGLDIVRNNPDIDLVITDMAMPKMDGLTMSEKIRNELQNSKVRILALTTTSDRHVKERRHAAGITVWGVKPFHGESAIDVIHHLLKMPEHSASRKTKQ
ncbi:MAG: response regulator [SAR324 cluster bacterium]|nr:response regulator [SAR324 cluster bacterium]